MSALDTAFIESQRQRLLDLRKQLIGSGDAAGSDEAQLQAAAGDEPQDGGDDGERLDQQERDEAVLAHSEARVVEIDRALAKIEDGTYGLSDGNGEAIPRDRLEAVPETRYTLEEMEDREREARRL